MSKRYTYVIASLILFLLVAPLASAQVYLPFLLRDSPAITATLTPTETPIPADRFLVTRVIDGDTGTGRRGQAHGSKHKHGETYSNTDSDPAFGSLSLHWRPAQLQRLLHTSSSAGLL